MVQVDRSVTGLVAQQQCVGPLHTPLADVAVVALSHFSQVRGQLVCLLYVLSHEQYLVHSTACAFVEM